MVEEIVLQGQSFEKNKKWLKKYSENEGLNYESITSHLELIFSGFEIYKNFPCDQTKQLLLKFSDLGIINSGLIDSVIVQIITQPHSKVIDIKTFNSLLMELDEMRYKLKEELLSGISLNNTIKEQSEKIYILESQVKTNYIWARELEEELKALTRNPKK